MNQDLGSKVNPKPHEEMQHPSLSSRIGQHVGFMFCDTLGDFTLFSIQIT